MKQEIHLSLQWQQCHKVTRGSSDSSADNCFALILWLSGSSLCRHRAQRGAVIHIHETRITAFSGVFHKPRKDRKLYTAVLSNTRCSHSWRDSYNSKSKPGRGLHLQAVLQCEDTVFFVTFNRDERWTGGRQRQPSCDWLMCTDAEQFNRIYERWSNLEFIYERWGIIEESPRCLKV